MSDGILPLSGHAPGLSAEPQLRLRRRVAEATMRTQAQCVKLLSEQTRLAAPDPVRVATATR